MSKNIAAPYVDEPWDKSVVISTANTALDGTGTIVDVTPTTINSGRVDSVQIIAQAATTAGQINFFINTGSAWEIYDSVSVTAVTPTATVLPFKTVWTPPGGVLTLPADHKLGAAPYNAETFSLHPDGGKF